MVVLLSLVAAAVYGLSDFVGGSTSRRAGPWVIAFVSQLGGLVVTLLVLAVHAGSPSGADLAWGLLAGVGNGVGTAFLYRGLSMGRMGVVAPVSGVGAAVLPVLVGVATGERPGALAWAGLIVALPAIWLVASQVDGGDDDDDEGDASTSGGGTALFNGLLAGLGFGSLFAALAQVPGSAGVLPFTLNQVVGAVVVALVATTIGATWRPRTAGAAWGLVPGLLGVTATLLFAAAARQGLLSVSAVITSLYPAFTVLLAAVVLRERIGRRQGAGLALCGACVVLTALG